MRFLFFVLLIGPATGSFGQRVSGIVTEQTQTGIKPLTGATVRWQSTPGESTPGESTPGESTPGEPTPGGAITDSVGRFSIPHTNQTNRLIISYVGYQSDTLTVTDLSATLRVRLRPDATLREVTITASSTEMDRLNPIHTEILTRRTLTKAACCNLSESFETNASVSVSYTDAVTGAKQIQFLGLGGQYVQTNVENIPTVRGLATTFGLNYIPGTWINSIDVGKGAGSVVNGYEAMTGQINVELQKPDEPLANRLLINGYVNSFGRVEGNLNWSAPVSKQWSVATLAHASTLRTERDANHDGFLDLPLYTQYNLVNRWKYQTDRWMVQFGGKALSEDRTGGTTSAVAQAGGSAYRFGSLTNREEVFAKIARLYPNKPYKGLGLILNGLHHAQTANFGFRPYAALERSLYANLIYQNIIGTTDHTYRAGLSYLYDTYDETLGAFTGRNPTPRTESVPGAFAEYTYQNVDRLTLVLGARADYHNLFGWQVTPRAHLRVQLRPDLTLRASAGRGFRVPNALAENFGYLASSRAITFLGNLQPERSWNYGLSLAQNFRFLGQKATLVLDYYRTDFQNQLVADLEQPHELNFYTIENKSFANSFQVELTYHPIRRLETKIAYRLVDVRQAMGGPFGESLVLPRMMVSRDRLLINAAYALPFDKWKADFTAQYNGPKRLPDTREGHNHTTYAAMPIDYSPGFWTVNAQISKALRNGLELYLGGENLTGFRQQNPIVQANDPYGVYFDAAANVWGPITGQMVYAGFRFKPVR